MILGCVLAGGESSRFGSDKALAEIGGESLLARAVDLLAGWCEHVVVAGRAEAPAPTLPDAPRPGMGPLGGLAAALHHAVDEGYDAVLTIGVDALDLPENLPAQLAPAPAYITQQPVVGLWPASASPVLDALLARDERHSMRHFAELIAARPVQLACEPANINTPADLAALAARVAREHSHGL